MPKTAASHQARRVLTLNTEGIEIRHHEEDHILEILVDETIPLPFKLFDALGAWARDAGFSPLEADQFQESMGEKAVRLIDERFILDRLLS